MAAKYIKNAGDARLAFAKLPDDAPIQFSLNGVATKAYLLPPGVEGGDTTIIVEPNYTCNPPSGHVSPSRNSC